MALRLKLEAVGLVDWISVRREARSGGERTVRVMVCIAMGIAFALSW